MSKDNNSTLEQVLNLRKVLDAMPSASFQLDADGKISYVNELWTKVTGVSQEQAIGDSWLQSVGESQKDQAFDKWNAYVEEGVLFELEYEYVTRSESKFWIKTQIKKISDNNGLFVCYLGNIEDISESKECSRQLLDSVKLVQSYRDTLNSSVIFIKLDAKGFISDINKKFLNVSGFTREELVGIPFASIFNQDFNPFNLNNSLSLLVGGKTLTFDELSFKSKNGDNVFVEVTMVPKINSNNELVKINVVQIDVSYKNKSKETFSKIFNKLDVMAFSSELGYWEWDLASGHVYYDDRWAAMLGYKVKDLEQRLSTWEMLCHPDDKLRVQQGFTDYLDGKLERYEFTFRMKHKDDSWVWVLSKGKIYKWNEDGSAAIFSGTHYNVTSLIELEKRAINSEVKAMAQERYSMMVDMAKGIAHEINNPLGIILGYSQLLLSKYESFVEEEVKLKLKKIIDAAERASNTVKSLHGITGTVGEKPLKTINVDEFFQSIIYVLDHRIKRASVSLQTNLCSKAVFNAVPSEFSQIVYPLLINACEAAEKSEDKIIKIKSYKSDDHIYFEISDSGNGIDEGDIPKIFNPFFSRKESSDSSGLGLSVAKAMAESCGGSIEYIKKSKSDYTLFRVSLPLDKSLVIKKAS